MENLKLIVNILLGLCGVFVITKIFIHLHKLDLAREKEAEDYRQKLQNKVKNMHDEELVYVWGEIFDMLKKRSFFEGSKDAIYLELVEKELEKRGLKKIDL